jgi:hypothetical protein
MQGRSYSSRHNTHVEVTSGQVHSGSRPWTWINKVSLAHRTLILAIPVPWVVDGRVGAIVAFAWRRNMNTMIPLGW